MRITFFVGATATKLIKGKPDTNATKFYGGETEDIVDKEAKILVPEFAAKADSKEAKEFLKVHSVDPRTRRQRVVNNEPYRPQEKKDSKGKAKPRTLSPGAQAAVRSARSARTILE